MASKKKKRLPNPGKAQKTELYNQFIKSTLSGTIHPVQLFEVPNQDGTIDLDYDEFE